MLTYEEQLDRDFNWGLLEGSLYFGQKIAVHTTMRRFAQRLDRLAIEYAVAGDVENGVRIRFLVSGDSACQDSSPVMVIPGPAEVQEIIDAIPFIDVAPLIALKFALGDASHRIRHIADIQELIRHLRLPIDFADQLPLYRRSRFEALWADAQIALADDY